MSTSKNTIRSINKLILSVPGEFLKLEAKDLNFKSSPKKWSKKEILGHLIDSAFNNVQRLIRVQYEPGVKIVYDQDDWVKINDYQSRDIDSILNLWILINKEFIRLADSIPEKKLKDTIDTGKEGIEMHTAQFLINDYLDHMRHHLSQIFD